jgi:hypothetical protein
MDLAEFKRSLAAERPPAGISLALEALWWEAKGDWDAAHRAAQQQEDAAGAWVHAYLHRREGDAENARYWYRRAGKSEASVALDRERDAIIDALLAAG